MCGGGGGGGSGNDATYQANIDRDLRNAEQQRADAATAANTAEKQAARDKYTAAMAAAPEKGRTVYQKYITDRGLPYNANDEAAVVQGIIDKVPDLETNVNKYFSSESVGTGLDTVAQGTRDRLSNQVKSTFGSGFENTLIPDTADDAIINSILGEQRTNAQKIVDFNKARGLLNDTGYQAAQAALNTQGTAGYGTLSGIGESVLGKSRQKLTDIKGEAGSDVSGYTYGGTSPDVGSYYSRAQKSAADTLAGLEGSIRGAVGSTNVYDAPVALQKGGTLQGPINLTTAATGALGSDKTKKDQGRGLGSSGVF